MSQSMREPEGGLIDRSQRLGFEFDGRRLEGHPGDTVASALLANGVRLVGRSFKYHRPRGIVGGGVEEPNALLQLGRGPRTEPNLRATQVELFDGLVCDSQNRWPSLDFDIGGLNNVFSRLLPAGFYYKTFMWPAGWWMFYEHFVRRAAGLGRAPVEHDDDTYAKRYAHCDVMVVGGGPAGLAGALAAARRGVRVMLVDEQAQFGGSLLRDHELIDGEPAMQWVHSTVAELEAAENVRILDRATAFGYYDQNLIAVCERLADHQARPSPYQPRQRIWWVRARQVVLATGSIERPLVFGNNDVPGVMLASAVRGYAVQQAVRCGRRAVVFTNNDDAYRTAVVLAEQGVAVRAVVDARLEGAGEAARAAVGAAGVEVLTGHVVIDTQGEKSLQSVEIGRYDGKRVSALDVVECDLLCMSGGYIRRCTYFRSRRAPCASTSRAQSSSPASPGRRNDPRGPLAARSPSRIACRMACGPGMRRSTVSAPPAGRGRAP